MSESRRTQSRRHRRMDPVLYGEEVPEEEGELQELSEGKGK